MLLVGYLNIKELLFIAFEKSTSNPNPFMHLGELAVKIFKKRILREEFFDDLVCSAIFSPTKHFLPWEIRKKLHRAKSGLYCIVGWG